MNKFKELLRYIYYLNIFLRLKSKGKNIRLSKGGTITRPNELSIGSNVFIAKGFIISPRVMKIGNNIMIGPYFVAECDDHLFDKVGKPMFSYRQEREIKPIIIEDDVWIGGHVSILKGVKIGEGCIIGAGSVVTKSLPPYTICFGNPCKVYKNRFLEKDLMEHLSIINSSYKYSEIINIWQEYNLQIQK